MEVSGPWLKKIKNTSINNRSLQRFKTHNELEIGTTVFLHAFILTANVGKFHSVSNDSPDLMSVKSRLNISQLN